MSDGVTEALDGRPLEDTVPIANVRRTTAAELCDRFMTTALAGSGPPGAVDWDDDRTVVVVKVCACHEKQLSQPSWSAHGALVK